MSLEHGHGGLRSLPKHRATALLPGRDDHHLLLLTPVTPRAGAAPTVAPARSHIVKWKSRHKVTSHLIFQLHLQYLFCTESKAYCVDKSLLWSQKKSKRFEVPSCVCWVMKFTTLVSETINKFLVIQHKTTVLGKCCYISNITALRRQPLWGHIHEHFVSIIEKSFVSKEGGDWVTKKDLPLFSTPQSTNRWQTF